MLLRVITGCLIYDLSSGINRVHWYSTEQMHGCHTHRLKFVPGSLTGLQGDRAPWRWEQSSPAWGQAELLRPDPLNSSQRDVWTRNSWHSKGDLLLRIVFRTEDPFQSRGRAPGYFQQKLMEQAHPETWVGQPLLGLSPPAPYITKVMGIVTEPISLLLSAVWCKRCCSEFVFFLGSFKIICSAWMFCGC